MKLLMSQEWITGPQEKFKLKMEKKEELAGRICLQLICQPLEKDGSQQIQNGGRKRGGNTEQ